MACSKSARFPVQQLLMIQGLGSEDSSGMTSVFIEHLE